MSSDAAYRARYLAAARTLWDCSKGNPAEIPCNYTEHLEHRYSDGSVSLVPTLSKFEFADALEPEEWDEAVELLSKVSEHDWPNVEDIESVNLEELLRIYDTDACSMETSDYVEDNLGTAEKCEKVLKAVIESVFGEEIDSVRSKSGDFPTVDNKFLQIGDGTFSGTFIHGDHKFNFEVFPDESGWTVTYRMSSQTLDALPPLHDADKQEDDPTKKDYSRRVRKTGWR